MERPYLRVLFILQKISIIAFCITNSVFAQSIEGSNINQIKVNIGSAINIVKPQKNGNLAIGNSLSLGISIEKKNLYHDLNFSTGISACNLKVEKYQNHFFDIFYQKNVTLKTELNQYYIEMPFLIRKKEKKWIFGIGLITSYLFKSNLTQTVISNDYPDWLLESFHSTYDIHSSKELAPFSRINISPCLNIGIDFKKRWGVEISTYYNLLYNPRNYYKISPYNLLTTSLFITYKIN